MPSLPPPSSLLLFLCSSFSLQVCKLHCVPPFFQHPCVLLFLSMLSCSSILLQVFKLQDASLVVLPPMIPPPTIVPPISYNSISYKCNSFMYHQHCNLLLSLLFFFAFFWFCSLIAIFFYLFPFFLVLFFDCFAF